MHSWELLHHKRPCFISFCRVLFACEGLASKYFFISSLRSLLIKFMPSCHGIYFFLQSMMISITYATFSFLNGITSSIFLSSPPIFSHRTFTKCTQKNWRIQGSLAEMVVNYYGCCLISQPEHLPCMNNTRWKFMHYMFSTFTCLET